MISFGGFYLCVTNLMWSVTFLNFVLTSTIYVPFGLHLALLYLGLWFGDVVLGSSLLQSFFIFFSLIAGRFQELRLCWVRPLWHLFCLLSFKCLNSTAFEFIDSRYWVQFHHNFYPMDNWASSGGLDVTSDLSLFSTKWNLCVWWDDLSSCTHRLNYFFW